MMPNICAHHVHSLSIYNHLHNGYMASTNNNTCSTSVYISKNYSLISKPNKIPYLYKHYFPTHGRLSIGRTLAFGEIYYTKFDYHVVQLTIDMEGDI